MTHKETPWPNAMENSREDVLNWRAYASNRQRDVAILKHDGEWAVFSTSDCLHWKLADIAPLPAVANAVVFDQEKCIFRRERLDWHDVIWCEFLSLFVAVGISTSDYTGICIATSPNGEIWTRRTPPYVRRMIGCERTLTYSQEFMADPLAQQWIKEIQMSGRLLSILYSDALYILSVVDSQDRRRLISSYDGVVWAFRDYTTHGRPWNILSGVAMPEDGAGYMKNVSDAHCSASSASTRSVFGKMLGVAMTILGLGER